MLDVVETHKSRDLGRPVAADLAKVAAAKSGNIDKLT